MTDAPVLAVDLGASRLKAGVVDGGTVRDFVTAPTRDADAETALETLTRTAAPLVDEHGATRLGLSVPGIVEDGRVIALPGKFPGIVGRDLAGEIADTLGLDAVVVVNDAVAYGAGEAVHGAGTGHRRVVVATIGTGVGTCVMEDGRPVASGPLGAGILGGQIPIDDPDDGPTDTNGMRGTIEARCAADRLLTYAERAGGTYTDIPAIYAAADRGEDAAQTGISTYRRWLVRAVVALAHAHTPSVIVLGGGPMRAGNPITDGVEEQVATHLWPGYEVRVRLATLGDEASLHGVGHLAASGGR